MSLHSTSREVESLLYTLSTTLECFKGVNGLQRLMTTGKLSLLSLFGEFEQTRDEVYEKRSAAVTQTRQCLVQLADHFDDVTGTTEKLVRKVDCLLATLEQFHRCCDMEIDDRVKMNDSDVQQLDRDFQSVREANSGLKVSLRDFAVSEATCVGLTRSAIHQVEKVNTDTLCDVTAALTDFDRQRRRVQVKEGDLTSAVSRAASRDDPAVQFAEFNYLKESRVLEGVGRKYIESLGGAMEATHFALEQSSMTGWAAANVFFVQLGLLLGELSTSSAKIAANLLSIKNSQKVSRQLTDEKRRNLEALRAAATSAATAPAATNLFGDDGSESPASPATPPRPATSSCGAPSPPPPPPPATSMQSPDLYQAAAPPPTQTQARSSVNLEDLFQ